MTTVDARNFNFYQTSAGEQTDHRKSLPRRLATPVTTLVVAHTFSFLASAALLHVDEFIDCRQRAFQKLIADLQFKDPTLDDDEAKLKAYEADTHLGELSRIEADDNKLEQRRRFATY